MKRRMSKQEMINMLSQLHTLLREGKNVQSLIDELESMLFEKCDEDMDEERKK